MSNVGSKRLGWVHTSNADFLGIYNPRDSALRIASFDDVRRELASNWGNCKPLRILEDNLVEQRCVIVPIDEFDKIVPEHFKIAVPARFFSSAEEDQWTLD